MINMLMKVVGPGSNAWSHNANVKDGWKPLASKSSDPSIAIVFIIIVIAIWVALIFVCCNEKKKRK